MSRLTPSRRVAYNVLHEVAAKDAYANLALAAALQEADLSRADAGFVTDLVYTCLRRRRTLDAVIATMVDRPLNKLDPRLLDVLRLAATEHIYLHNSAHAVVDNAVELARSVVGQGPSKLANAVGRKIVRQDPAALVESVVAAADPAMRLGIEYSHPDWIVRALQDVLPRSDQIEDLLAADNRAPRVTLAARVGDRDRLPGESTPWSPWGVYLDSGSPGSVREIRNGQAGVQDLGSQLMVLAFTRIRVAGPESAWLDMCAGPGGKTALLARELPEGVRLDAVDQHEHRSHLVAQSVRFAADRVTVRTADARTVSGVYDRILLDAPCTGLGVVRRRPELRWRRTPQHVAELSTLQRELLNAALDACRPGGVVAYVTCSPHLAETDIVVDDVTRRRDDVAREDCSALLAEVPGSADGSDIRLWPHRHDTDGMYMALLRKK